MIEHTAISRGDVIYDRCLVVDALGLRGSERITVRRVIAQPFNRDKGIMA
jgi:hypothetical protein